MPFSAKQDEPKKCPEEDEENLEQIIYTTESTTDEMAEQIWTPLQYVSSFSRCRLDLQIWGNLYLENINAKD